MAASALKLEAGERPSAAQLLRCPLLLSAALSQHERSAAHVSPSLQGLQQLVEAAAWLAPHRVANLPWEQAVTPSVRLCTCGANNTTAASAEAAGKLLRLISAAPGNGAFGDDYTVSKSVLCFSRARAGMHVAKALDLSTRVASGLLRLETEVNAAATSVVDARRRVLRRLDDHG